MNTSNIERYLRTFTMNGKCKKCKYIAQKLISIHPISDPYSADTNKIIMHFQIAYMLMPP